MKKCILNLGGSFNPPTVAHLNLLSLARNRLEEEGFTEFHGFLTPTHGNYEKQGLLGSPIRKELCEKCVEGSDWISVNDFEISNAEWTKTIITLNNLKERFPDSKVFMVCGADLILRWNNPIWNPDDVHEILDNFGVCIISRIDTLDSIIKQVPVLNGHMQNVYLIKDNPMEAVSSTYVRNLLSHKKSISGLVVPAVEKYIKENDLYSEI
ncbi:nicotinamide/nicotinic acid mononucleotide adenylyltransferase isoform X1 [Histomonas meleagridis]|uniref:nicotinamide/nicotinic acid mononucleotide adenylyltransferase isoform X1 n=1 Tax=Histomonas meleagridis TaxID=135588 RepID=UPI003559AEB5|nr:nicotinamide/nicotinic acid mononucleotide adenylyltransferase isoform X1 [Histomonas meleagridis]KAH0799226.1 nicotinamide/nicotinic acid mononucleotide adenylyltransferase isoform X1 [Histomonas meleagridis]